MPTYDGVGLRGECTIRLYLTGVTRVVPKFLALYF